MVEYYIKNPIHLRMQTLNQDARYRSPVQPQSTCHQQDRWVRLATEQNYCHVDTETSETPAWIDLV
jgi:hypothetical protein